MRSLSCAPLLLLLLAGCGDSSGGSSTGSGATCPTGSALTYDNFGKQFMATYCTRCHASTVSGAARNKAPSDINFDTLAGIQPHRTAIDRTAASGPDNTNTEMPEGTPKPSQAERAQLGEWIACGAP